MRAGPARQGKCVVGCCAIGRSSSDDEEVRRRLGAHFIKNQDARDDTTLSTKGKKLTRQLGWRSAPRQNGVACWEGADEVMGQLRTGHVGAHKPQPAPTLAVCAFCVHACHSHFGRILGGPVPDEVVINSNHDTVPDASTQPTWPPCAHCHATFVATWPQLPGYIYAYGNKIGPQTHQPRSTVHNLHITHSPQALNVPRLDLPQAICADDELNVIQTATLMSDWTFMFANRTRRMLPHQPAV